MIVTQRARDTIWGKWSLHRSFHLAILLLLKSLLILYFSSLVSQRWAPLNDFKYYVVSLKMGHSEGYFCQINGQLCPIVRTGLISQLISCLCAFHYYATRSVPRPNFALSWSSSDRRRRRRLMARSPHQTEVQHCSCRCRRATCPDRRVPTCSDTKTFFFFFIFFVLFCKSNVANSAGWRSF